MATKILDIYDDIAAFSLTGVNVRNIDEIKLAVAQADLPMRLLLPSTRGEGAFIAIGSLTAIQWTIRDLCLWAPLSAGSIAQYSPAIIAYISEYLTALKADRAPTSQSHITGFAIEIHPTPWADSDFWAVDITIQVEEIL